jgi:hypothetical protein
MEKVEKDCLKSVDDFGKHYDGCPYAHTLQEVPDDVKEVLHSQTVYFSITQMTVEEKKARIREMILAKKPSVSVR